MPRRGVIAAALLVFVAATDYELSAQTIEPIDPPAIFNVPYPSEIRIVDVADSAALEMALANAQGGDVITLHEDQTYRPIADLRFHLPAVASADDDHWIVIRSRNTATFGVNGSIPPNTRVDNSAATLAQMPKVRSPQNQNQPSASVFFANPGAHHIRLVGLDIAPDASHTNITNIVELGDSGASTAADLASSIVIDRCYIHGRNDSGTYRRGVSINGSRIAVIESYLENLRDPNGQANGIGAISGAGPVKIVNNYIDALGENILFGGGDPRIENILFEDIEIRRNRVIKTASPGTSGACNLFELKQGRRVLVEGNVFEKNWSGCQDGAAVLFKSSNQNDGHIQWSNSQWGCYWCVTEHVTFRNNIIRHAGGCFNAVATNNADTSGPGHSLPLNHVRIENVVCDDIGASPYSGSSKVLVLNRGQNDDVVSGQPTIQHFQVIHVTTITNQGAIVETSGDKDGNGNKISIAPNFVWQYNLTERRCYGIEKGGDEGTVALNSAWFAPSTYSRSVLVNTSEACAPIADSTLLAKYPTGTCVASDWSDVEVDRQRLLRIRHISSPRAVRIRTSARVDLATAKTWALTPRLYGTPSTTGPAAAPVPGEAAAVRRPTLEPRSRYLERYRLRIMTTAERELRITTSIPATMAAPTVKTMSISKQRPIQAAGTMLAGSLQENGSYTPRIFRPQALIPGMRELHRHAQEGRFTSR
jgi:hypothetical protein